MKYWCENCKSVLDEDDLELYQEPSEAWDIQFMKIGGYVHIVEKFLLNMIIRTKLAKIVSFLEKKNALMDGKVQEVRFVGTLRKENRDGLFHYRVVHWVYHWEHCRSGIYGFDGCFKSGFKKKGERRWFAEI